MTFKRDNYLFYIVRAKETLSDIAAKFNGVNISDIMILNNFRGTQIPEAGSRNKNKEVDRPLNVPQGALRLRHININIYSSVCFRPSGVWLEALGYFPP
ncbi:MAG: LysM peptidoglycan-binding domain-containing protein [Saprospiraceae bacterium]|nr:LysM peptidoglycan-binding domain-containing protein [Saprospiraceae bacterium]